MKKDDLLNGLKEISYRELSNGFLKYCLKTRYVTLKIDNSKYKIIKLDFGDMMGLFIKVTKEGINIGEYLRLCGNDCYSKSTRIIYEFKSDKIIKSKEEVKEKSKELVKNIINLKKCIEDFDRNNLYIYYKKIFNEEFCY